MDEPLVNGIVDVFEERGLAVFGLTRAAILEVQGFLKIFNIIFLVRVETFTETNRWHIENASFQLF